MWVGECFFWSQLTRVVPDKILKGHKMVVCVSFLISAHCALCICSILRAMAVNNKCVVSCCNACINNQVTVHEFETAVQHAERDRQWDPLFSDIIATFRAAIRWAVTRPSRSLSYFLWSKESPKANHWKCLKLNSTGWWPFMQFNQQQKSNEANIC